MSVQHIYFYIIRNLNSGKEVNLTQKCPQMFSRDCYVIFHKYLQVNLIII